MQLFGREIEVAEQVVKLPLMRVDQAVRRAGREGLWDVRIVPVASSEVTVRAQFLPPRRDEHAEVAA